MSIKPGELPVDASGILQWATNGVPICTVLRDQYHPEIISDSDGGAIITWYDKRPGDFDINIYAQRVDASGASQWTANGVAICTATRNQQEPDIISDGTGGAIITWEDYRNGNTMDVYAHRVDASGASQWTANGVAICTATRNQQEPDIISDGTGGAIVTWQDDRDATTGEADIYAQRVDASGAVQWMANGAPVCAASGDQAWHQITSDGAGGAIVSWQDSRGGATQVYTQLIDQYGHPGGTVTGVDEPETPRIAYLAQNYPNPFNLQTKIAFGLKQPSPASLQIYAAAGHLVRVLVYSQRPAGDFEKSWDGRNQVGKRVPAGVYFYRLEAGSTSVSKKMVLVR